MENQVLPTPGISQPLAPGHEARIWRLWLRITDEEPGSRVVSYELGIWTIGLTLGMGWWRIEEAATETSGGWLADLPYEAASMLWAGIVAHRNDCGDEPLAPPWGGRPQ